MLAVDEICIGFGGVMSAFILLFNVELNFSCERTMAELTFILTSFTSHGLEIHPLSCRALTHPSLWLSGISLCIGTAHISFTQLSVPAHLGRFQTLAIVSSVPIVMGVLVSLQCDVLDSPGNIPWQGTAESNGISVLRFWGFFVLF